MARMTQGRFNFLSMLVALAAAYTVMIDLCEDRPNCSVLASPETFTQDPCEGTSKYVEAHYKCRPRLETDDDDDDYDDDGDGGGGGGGDGGDHGNVVQKVEEELYSEDPTL
ncbi:adhesion g protein-coupled receptor l3 [Plakobranchus ocellatus]|uniref:Adhesion g protein-coupled receptor l3 n=1 Tax=Plakobranchus ocellatus TaxID=259542 RepID=A0AAV4A5Q6_9GAST|nr:adhesion g protein-coupled receptor l3 [Plakobranchus ocellatus]